MTSNSSTPRPSMRTTRPSSTTSSGSGSLGPSKATSPSSGHEETSSSFRSSRASRATNRSDLRGAPLTAREESAVLVDGERLADEGGRLRCAELALEPLRPGREVGGGRATRPQRRVELEYRLGGHCGELRRAGQIFCERPAARRR